MFILNPLSRRCDPGYTNILQRGNIVCSYSGSEIILADDIIKIYGTPKLNKDKYILKSKTCTVNTSADFYEVTQLADIFTTSISEIDKVLDKYEVSDREAYFKIIENPTIWQSHFGEKSIDLLKTNEHDVTMLYKLAQLTSNEIADELYTHFENEALEVYETNPYVIVDYPNVGFASADKYALDFGISRDSILRYKAAIKHLIKLTCIQTGDTKITKRQLKSIMLLNIGMDLKQSTYDEALEQLIEKEQLYDIGQYYQLSYYHKAESYIAQQVVKRMYKQQSIDESQLKTLKDHLSINFTYDETQTNAIIDALKYHIYVLTGGPGTGKTTVIKGIIEGFKYLYGYTYKDFLLVAPTGRAASCMTEAINQQHYHALTTHKAFEIIPGRRVNIHQQIKNLDYVNNRKVIIIDESSMLDTFVTARILNNIDEHTHIIFVGDNDQLPSIAPGQVLHDLLNANIPHTKLNKVYRQGKNSEISMLAKYIREEKMFPDDYLTLKNQTKFFDTSQIKERAIHTLKHLFTNEIVLDSTKKPIQKEDVQVIVPYNKGEDGVISWNKLLQNFFNPENENTTPITIGPYEFRVGDRVMNTVNTPELNIVNGDIGYIKSINAPQPYVVEIEVIFKNNNGQMTVTFDNENMRQLVLGYAITIHKSQGGEFPIVVYPMITKSKLLSRNLIYTAITRAKDYIVMYGHKDCFKEASQVDGNVRKTDLENKISTLIEKEKRLA